MSSRSNSKRIPSGDNVASDGGLRRREIYLNGPSLERASKHITEGVLSAPSSKNSNKSKGSNQLHSEASGSNSRKSENSHRIHVSTGNDDFSATQKPRKVKLKIGGISRTIPTKPNPDIPDSRSSAARPTQPGDPWHRQKHGNQTEGAKDKGRLPSSQDKKTKKLRTIDTLTPEQPARVQRESSSDPVRKSRRIAKKSTFDSEFDEENDSSTLETLGASNVNEGRVRDSRNKGGSNSKNNASKKDRSRSTVYEVDNDFVTPQSNRDGNKRLRDSTAADVDDIEEEPVSDSELESENKKQKTVTESHSNVKSEPLTTRRRALQSWMDGNSNSTVEFPDGLPAASSRSKKEKLSEAEVLAKKAEAAQRRKLQVEKATKESEAEAIRKILGLDTEKKKEEKKQKEREEKEKAARAQELARNSIRWVMGPTGTVVSFPDGVGLPSIFNSKPCSYPPPREKCAGPSCTNVYRYRDSKLKLPLCSLECYKAVRGNA
uniref:Uncharacterized protein n=1 Tax=Avena sativa TaxID=4498 RepID=A0ACD5Y6E8_AVESA